MKQNFKRDVFVTGFALFAMFFGAGNLIFPPFLGWISGKSWFVGFLSFIAIDVGLSVLTLMVIAKIGKGTSGISEKLGKKVSYLVMALNVICLGPLIAIPRTGATTFEIAVLPVFENASLLAFTSVFFIIVVVLSIKQTKVVDIVGSILAPVMFVALVFLVIKGVMSPLGEITKQAITSEVVKEGILSGYQTMDMMAAIVFSAGLFVTIADKGYTTVKQQFNIISLSGIVSAVALAVVYGGLTYLGATVSGKYTEVVQGQLLVEITNSLMGKGGVVLLGIIVGTACLTTAIGLVSSSATFFASTSGGKIKYEAAVIVLSAVSFLLSNMGLSTIISFAAPILDIIYPVLVILIFMGLAENKIKNKNVYIFSCSAAFITCVALLIEKLIGAGFISRILPLSQYGFAWVLPAVLFGVIGAFVKPKDKA